MYKYVDGILSCFTHWRTISFKGMERDFTMAQSRMYLSFKCIKFHYRRQIQLFLLKNYFLFKPKYSNIQIILMSHEFGSSGFYCIPPHLLVFLIHLLVRFLCHTNILDSPIFRIQKYVVRIYCFIILRYTKKDIIHFV